MQVWTIIDFTSGKRGHSPGRATRYRKELDRGSPDNAARLRKIQRHLNKSRLWIFTPRSASAGNVDEGRIMEQPGMMEGPITSDFSAARLHLERAHHCLRGNDETSRSACGTLDQLIETVTEAQHKRPVAGIIAFPGSATR